MIFLHDTQSIFNETNAEYRYTNKNSIRMLKASKAKNPVHSSKKNPKKNLKTNQYDYRRVRFHLVGVLHMGPHSHVQEAAVGSRSRAPAYIRVEVGADRPPREGNHPTGDNCPAEDNPQVEDNPGRTDTEGCQKYLFAV